MKTSYPEKEGTAKGLKFTNQFGKYLISHYNTWHGGVHIEGTNRPIQAIADGRIIAYRIMDNYLELPKTKSSTKQNENEEDQEEVTYKYSNSFVLIQHDLELTSQGSETTEAEKKTVTFYSLYNHLMPITEIQKIQEKNKKNTFPKFMEKEQLTVTATESFVYKKQKRSGLNARSLNSLGKINWRDATTKKVVIPFGKKVTKALDPAGNLIKVGNYVKVTFTDENGDFYNDIYINIAPTKTRKLPRVKDLGTSFEIIIKEDHETWVDKSSVPEDKKDLKGARVRDIPNTSKDSTIIDILEHNKVFKIKGNHDKDWYVTENPKGYVAKINFDIISNFDDSKITKEAIFKCDIPIKAEDHIGYTGLLTNEQNQGYAACQLDVFMEEGTTEFLTNNFGAGKNELYFSKIEKGTLLRKEITTPVDLKKNDTYKVLDIKGNFAKVKPHEEELTKMVRKDLLGEYQAVQGKDYYEVNAPQLAAININFGNKLPKGTDRLYWVCRVGDDGVEITEKAEGDLIKKAKTDKKQYVAYRRVKYIPNNSKKEYWIKLEDLDKKLSTETKKIEKKVQKNITDYESFVDYIIGFSDRYKTVEEEITVPIKVSVKPNDTSKLLKDVSKAYVAMPDNEKDTDEILDKEALIDVRKSKTNSDKKWIQVHCKYVKGSKEITQKGWIENNLTKFSAFNWDSFGFKPFEAGEEFIYDVKGLRDIEKTTSKFIEKLWGLLEVFKDNLINSDELRIAYSILEIQQNVAKMVCNHKIEWSYTPDEIAEEISKIYDYLISQQPEDAKSDLEQLKQDKLEVHKAQVENLMFWNALKDVQFATKVTENDTAYETENAKLEEKYHTFTTAPELDSVNNKEVALQLKNKEIEKDTLDKKYTKGKYAPEPPKFPTKDKVYHFHPIAFINQLKLMFPQETGECYCNKDFTAEDLKKIVHHVRYNTFYRDTKNRKQHISLLHKDHMLFHASPDIPSSDQNNYERLAEVLNASFAKRGITNCSHKIHYLANMYVETQYFSKIEESGNNHSYMPYKGRGFIHITHDYNYKAYSDVSGHEDIVSGTNYKKVTSSLELAADTGSWFWEKNKVNELAEKDDIFGTSKKINAPNATRTSQVNGYKMRRAAWIKFKEAFNNYPYNCVTDASKNPREYGKGVLEEMRKWADLHVQYKQESEFSATKFRSSQTKDALGRMDCSEFVCRYLHKLGVTNSVKVITTSGMITQEEFRKNLGNDNIEKVTGDTPKAGDIFVWGYSYTNKNNTLSWAGHTGIVHSVDGDNITILESIGMGGSSDENHNRNTGGYEGYNCTRTSVYQKNGGALASHDGWKGYYRPKNYTKQL